MQANNCEYWKGEKKLPYLDSSVKNTHQEITDILSHDFNVQKKREFVLKKIEYLEKNKILDDDKFIELFWWMWKYDKSEIKQDNNLWLCYAYTGFEILKKSNFFKELIQTNFREIWEWKREVRIPFSDPNWYWMKVDENEIFDENWNDRQYSFVPRNSKTWKEKVVKVTSWSSLWFKILEIAFIKSYIVFNSRYSSEAKDIPSISARGQFNLAWDFKIKEWHLRAIESWNVWWFMQHLFWKNVVKYNNPDIEMDLNYENLIKEFNAWFVKIALTPRNEWDLFFDNNSDIKIINKKDQMITKVNKNKDGTKFKIMSYHVYSIEKFYETQQWEKRVWIVNPWNTAEKIDMPVKKCIDIFKRQVIWFDIDKMFINKNEES